MRSNPSGSKESKVLNVTHNSVWIRESLVGFSDGRARYGDFELCAHFPVIFLPRRIVVALFFANTILEVREGRGFLDLPPFSREDCEHIGDIAQLVER